MRIISRTATRNVPYEQVTIELEPSGEWSKVVTAMLPTGTKLVLGTYSNEQAEEVFEEIIKEGIAGSLCYRMPQQKKEQ